jgi:hypothetical protein
MMLEVGQKIISNIIRIRLTPIVEEIEHESQCGFRHNRGTGDAIFNLKMALKKRKEHNLETWVLFIDFVKAFDRVPRDILWKTLGKFGAPPKFIRLIITLHNIIVKFSVDGAEAEMESIIGVKQGDVLGPILFILYMAALTISWKKKEGRSMCLFRTKQDSTLTGRRYNTVRGVEEFEMSESAYADDAAFLFPSREIAARDTSHIIQHCNDWGMEIHHGLLENGNGKQKESKTKLLFVAKPFHSYNNPPTFDDADLSLLMIDNQKFIPVVNSFCYLGSMVTTDLKDSTDVNTRIKKSSKAFGSLRRGVFTSKSVSFKAKKAIYTGLILAILFHGAEAWNLTEKDLSRLQCFHAQCVRAMCRVTKYQTWKKHIPTFYLLNTLDLNPIEFYLDQRQI